MDLWYASDGAVAASFKRKKFSIFCMIWIIFLENCNIPSKQWERSLRPFEYKNVLKITSRALTRVVGRALDSPGTVAEAPGVCRVVSSPQVAQKIT